MQRLHWQVTKHGRVRVSLEIGNGGHTTAHYSWHNITSLFDEFRNQVRKMETEYRGVRVLKVKIEIIGILKVQTLDVQPNTQDGGM